MNQRIKDPVELLYLSLMLRWEGSAPEDGKQGLLDGMTERNSQMARMEYLLKKVAAGAQEKTYITLSRYAPRQDGRTYISKDNSWMEEPRDLGKGWFFEGCTSLVQKQSILRGLTKVGLSAAFADCADDFVAGRSVRKYLPTEEETDQILVEIRRVESEQH